jgi:hypothetical protein
MVRINKKKKKESFEESPGENIIIPERSCPLFTSLNHSILQKVTRTSASTFSKLLQEL